MTIGMLRAVNEYKISTDIVSNVILISMFVSLLLTSADRFVALRFPMKYKVATGKCVIRVICCSWLPALCFIVIVKVKGVDVNQLKIVHTIMIAVATTVLMTTNALVYVVAKKHQKFVRENSYQYYRKERRKDKSMKATYFCVAVVMNFIVFWMPHCVHDITELTSSLGACGHMDVAEIVVAQLTPLNSLTDPILFICLSARTQLEIKKLVRPDTLSVKRQITEIVSTSALLSVTRL